MDLSSGTTIWNIIIMWWVGLASATQAPSAAERSYSLQYQAAAGCPDASVLTQAIETRVPGAQQQPAQRAAVRLRVELRRDGTGTLWLELPEGASRREFPSAACTNTVTTIGIVASMVLDLDPSERIIRAQPLMTRPESR
jgi:hypothetical protein